MGKTNNQTDDLNDLEFNIVSKLSYFIIIYSDGQPINLHQSQKDKLPQKTVS